VEAEVEGGVEAEYPHHHQEVEEVVVVVVVEAAEVLQEDHHHMPTEDSKETHLSNSQEIEREAKCSC